MSFFKKTVFISFLTCVIIGYFVKDSFDLKILTDWIDASPVYAPLIFMGLYFFLSLLFFPVFILTIASGALFGPYWGTLYTIISATLCASAAMLITRYFSDEWHTKLPDGMLKKIIAGVNKEGLLFVAFIRLVPIFPFSIANYALGFTKARLIPYTLVNFVCMLPASFAYSYIGFLGKSVANDPLSKFLHHLLIALAIMATLVFATSRLKKLYLKKFK